MNKYTKVLLAIGVVFFLQSCVVSKKKYEALDKQRKLSIDSLLQDKNNSVALLNTKRKTSVDSLQGIMSDFSSKYNVQRSEFSENDWKKNITIDSLKNQISLLAKDTSNIKKSLQSAVTDYNNQKFKLIKVEKNLVLKTKIVDSLTVSLNQKQKELLIVVHGSPAIWT